MNDKSTLARSKPTGYMRIFQRVHLQRLAIRRTARLALLAGLSLTMAVGCTMLPQSSEEATREKAKAWSLYIERSDQIEYLKNREANARIKEIGE